MVEFTDTYRQAEELVDQGFVRSIGLSNMTIPKLEAVLGKLRVKTRRLRVRAAPHLSAAGAG